MSFMLIDPYKSVGNLFFGDTRQEIRRKLNEEYDPVINEFEGRKEYFDWFKTSDLIVYYDENDISIAFEFYEVEPIFNGLNLKTEPFKNIIELFSKIDADLAGSSFEFTSYKYGVGGRVSHDKTNKIPIAESIIVFRKGYYDN